MKDFEPQEEDTIELEIEEEVEPEAAETKSRIDNEDKKQKWTERCKHCKKRYSEHRARTSACPVPSVPGQFHATNVFVGSDTYGKVKKKANKA